MRRYYNANESEENQINLTPLIDVVFVVLITFILIAPLLELDKIALAGKTSEGNMSESFQKSAIEIYVHEDNTIWINKKKIRAHELKPTLSQLHSEHPQTIPRLYQDRRATFGTYQTVKDIVETAGFTRLDIVLKSE